ncbi:unnamed protein product [Chironomus riparius]|uniref:SCP domain-containing protein n=1 Tax=Chironomus riparius TaxID=315576 RepID=A0A9N9RQN6_9DIPT|nr:unnamed protein product [Chironomus riparius]
MCISQKFSEFQVDCLEAHNNFRVQHGAQRVELDKDLCDYAKTYAEYLAKCNILVPSKNCTFGENIFFKCSDRKIYPDAIEPVLSWYDEGRNCSPKYPSKDIKHYAQVIWKSTRVMGVAYALNSTETKLYVVANYYPPGNDYATFCDNVKPVRKSYAKKNKSLPSVVKIV